ncbi:sensor histidine kinase [Aurantiacibacter xanthus]|uniref:C4-dicarboxylate transport sensor protein DctB n=1 Tax=Aurantiacibacter xanthus TaxID=1784712 RepID=A0A3A1P2L5_9SPHN|nr:ATP-binding protein [Aurantiacibacter xanthus]RIV84136.1 sensor histidine kinase [Aurantiacibacter xanthus]
MSSRPLPLFVRLAGAGVAALVLVGMLYASGRVATTQAIDSESRRAEASSILLASSFRRELDKFRLVPIVLADDRETRDALSTRDPARLAQLNRKLEALSDETRAAEVYLLDARGVTVAASNWQSEDSFVGDDYSYRAYYRDAMRADDAQQFALGQRSRRPGLYISKRVMDGDRILGVFVVKVDFSSVEREWRETATTAFVTDDRGIILVSATPEWQFQTTRPLSDEERTRARRLLDYGEVPLVQNRLYATGEVAPVGAASRAFDYVEASEDVGKGWKVHVLAPIGPAIAEAVAFAHLAVAIAAVALAALFLLWRVHRRGVAARIEREANTRLTDLREQLVQANKLATLGQITAGVAHEVNQPLAAISAYTSNARTLLERDKRDDAIAAIDQIGALTERIGLITRELRGFARRASGEIGPVAVEEALAGTALLLRDRLRMRGAEFVTTGSAIAVRAERVRLEQVLVNLVQNALDAGARTITATVKENGDRVAITVADDGAGLSDDMRATLFMPFKTSKQNGLGLGLVICRDIIADFGGTLKANTPAVGAEFVIDLERAR